MKAIRIIFSISLAIFFSQSVVIGQTKPGETSTSINVPTGLSLKDDRYRIGLQDVLDISVFNLPQMNVRVSINPDGTIILPRGTKPINAYCKTERELKAIIEEDYKSFLKNPYVNVIIAEQRSQSFGVMGAVEKPGNFFVNRRMPLLELLSFAGGPNKEAGSRLLVARLGSPTACKLNLDQDFSPENFPVLNFKIKDIQENKKNMLMQAGDVVSVLDSDIVYVYGNVNKQGEVKFKEPRTLRQVIAAAEGFSVAAKKDKIKVFRQKGETAEWQEFLYNIKDIESGKIADPYLMPNDIVAVSEDKFQKILGEAVKGITGGLGNLPIFVKP